MFYLIERETLLLPPQQKERKEKSADSVNTAGMD
jgi:hypothetical protein